MVGMCVSSLRTGIYDMKDTFPAVRFGNIGDLSPGIDSGNPRFIDSILGQS